MSRDRETVLAQKLLLLYYDCCDYFYSCDYLAEFYYNLVICGYMFIHNFSEIVYIFHKNNSKFVAFVSL